MDTGSIQSISSSATALSQGLSDIIEGLGQLGEEQTVEELTNDLMQLIIEALRSIGESSTVEQQGQTSSPAPTAANGGGFGTPHRAEAFAGPKGFLWKPRSDSDGKLAVLLPNSMTGKVAGVKILGAGGQLLASGRFSGVGNGGREHFRFDRSGSGFPPGSVVQIQFKNGSSQRIQIDQPDKRTEGR